jgi:lipopolysaccharide transport protein LptA
MAASFPKGLAALALLLPWLQASAVAATAVAATAAAGKVAQQPIVLDAQSGELDLRTGNEIFHKVRISQGDMVVTADQAQASQPGTKLNFNNSLLTFRGAVKINTDKGVLTADEAQLTFVNNSLTRAVATGKPAAFEQRVGKTGKQAKGQGETIDYDVPKGMVRFLKNAFLSLSDPQYEIHAQALKYDSINQKIIAEEAEQGSQRIHSIFTPPPPKNAPAVPPP